MLQFVVWEAFYKWWKFQRYASESEKVISIWIFSIRPLPLTRLKSCVGHFHRWAGNWCQKLAPDQSFIMRHCVNFSAAQMPSYSPWMDFLAQLFYALIWATCNSRNVVQMTERCSWHSSSLCNRFRGFSRLSYFLKLCLHQGGGGGGASKCMVLSSCCK